MTEHPRLMFGRRRLVAGLPALAAAAGAVLVVRNQLRHPPKHKPTKADGRPRRLVLAAASATRDPTLLAARDQGIFQRYNLEIIIADGIGSAPEALDRLQAGHADAAVAPALLWLPRLQQGLEARLACGLRAGSSRLLVARHSPFRRIEDLHRHAIGITEGDSADRLFFSIMMRRKGMNPNRDVEWRALPREALGLALSENKVQAIAGHDPGIWQLREMLHLDELASSQSGSYSARVSRVLGFRAALLRQDPEAAVAVVLALQQAASWAAGHPGEVAVMVAAADPDLTLPEVRHMLGAEGSGVHPIGSDLRDQIAQYVDELKLIGLAPEELDSTAFAKQITVDALKR